MKMNQVSCWEQLLASLAVHYLHMIGVSEPMLSFQLLALLSLQFKKLSQLQLHLIFSTCSMFLLAWSHQLNMMDFIYVHLHMNDAASCLVEITSKLCRGNFSGGLWIFSPLINWLILEQKKMCYAKVFLLHTVELETVLRV
jgi:hypothetical protein